MFRDFRLSPAWLQSDIQVHICTTKPVKYLWLANGFSLKRSLLLVHYYVDHLHNESVFFVYTEKSMQFNSRRVKTASIKRQCL